MLYFFLRHAVATVFLSMLFSSLALAQGFTYNTTLYGQRLYPNNRGSGCWGYSDTVIVNGQPRLRELALFGCFNGTSIVDITTPQLRELAFIPTQSNSPTSNGNSWREIRTSGHYAYITTEATGGGLQIVDLLPDPNNPDSVRLVSKFNTGGSGNNQHNLGTSAGYAWEADNYIYLCGGQVTVGFGNSGGMAIYDVSNPTNPVLMSRYATRYVHDVYVKNDTAYLANINDGFVDIVNVSNKSNPVRIRTFTYPAPNIGDAGTHNVWVTDDSKFIFTTDEVAPSGQNILRVHDARDYNNIVVNAATYKSPVGSPNAVVHNAYVRGKHIIMSYYTQGVKIVDISEPLDPVEVGAYNTYGSTTAAGYNGCWGVFPFYPSGKIIASDINGVGNSTGKLSVIEFNNARAGIVRGIIKDAVTEQVIAGAQIRAIDYYNKTRTSSTAGVYRIRTVQGANKRFVFSASGYRTDTLTINVPENGDSITVDVNLQPITSDTHSPQRPEGYALHQNYPNPFNPTTIITYQLEVPSAVKLELFDVMGRKLATLVDSKQSAGLHQYTLNASQLALSSGTYFYRLTANGFTDTKRMMLLK
jgi:choice-of-anchor B domain-containing protein